MSALFKRSNFKNLSSSEKCLAIIGGGPKALAIAAKFKVLKSFGFKTPKVIVFEKESVGYHWKASSAFTSGDLPLGTSPHKDITFPYATKFDDEVLNKKINASLQKYSWTTFLIEIGYYADWIDRDQPAPPHKLWAQYFEWVAEKVKDEVTFIFAEVTHIDVQNQKWNISYQNNHNNSRGKLMFDSLVITGPGKAIMPKSYKSEMKQVFDINGFWQCFNNKTFEKLLEITSISRCFRFAILGAGESSATICKTLLELKAKYQNIDIDIYVPNGLIFSRGESFWENNIYTNAEKYNWQSLSIETRKALMNRTDRGVFSYSMISTLSACLGMELNLIPAKADDVVKLNNEKVCVIYQLNGNTHKTEYDVVISAIGTSIAQFLDELLSQEARQHIKSSIRKTEISDVNLEVMMDDSLSVSGLQPVLHIPSLAMLNQGPGFGNLSCLGILADRVANKYIRYQASQEFQCKLVSKK